MANIKLKDHYWETEGIYDAAQSKTQKAINADIAEVAQNNSDLIILSNTQPSATGNKIWIKEGVSYQIPVMDDLISNNITNNSSVTGAKVTDALNTLSTNVSSLQGSLNTKLIKLTATLNSSVTSATIASWSNQTGITENSFVVEAKFSNPTAIISNITVTKDTGSVVLTGTTGASAGTIELIIGNK